MSRFASFLPLVPLFVAAATPAHAQRAARDTAQIAPVVVTATRSPLAPERAPASISIITGDQMRREGIANLADALRRVPGLALAQTGSYGGATSLFIRGGESKFTKVLIDGVPVNDAGGAYDFARLTSDNVDRVEIVRGPASVLYGSDAMAGVVQVFTRPGTVGTHAELSGRGGGYGSRDIEGAVRGGSDAATYSVGAARHTTDGIQQFNSGYSTGLASAMAAVHGSGADARLALRYTDAVYHFPTDGSGRVVDSNAVDRRDRLVVGLDAGARLRPDVELRLIASSYDTHGVVDNQPSGPPDPSRYYYTTADRTRRRSGEARVTIDLPASWGLTVGAQVERQWQDSRTRSSFGDNAFTATRRSTGGYAQLLFAPPTGHTVSLGGRYEHNEQFGDFIPWRSAVSVRVADRTRLRASLGTAFREPTFLENFGGGFVIGNPRLSPEHAVSADVGVEHDVTDWATVGATYFANSFRDLIDYKYSAKEPNYYNIARTRTGGAEVQGRLHTPSGLHADAAFTYLETRVITPGTSTASTAPFAAGAHLLRRPMHTLDAGVGFRGARGDITARGLRVGPREDNYFAPDFTTQHVTLPAYTRLDLSAEIAVGTTPGGRGTAALTGRLENALDARYTEAAGFNYDFSRTDDASLRQTGYRAPGRRMLVGLRLTY